MILNTFNTEEVIKCFNYIKERGDKSLMTDSNFSLKTDDAKDKKYLKLAYFKDLHRLDLREFNPDIKHFTCAVYMMPFKEFSESVLGNKFEGFDTLKPTD